MDREQIAKMMTLQQLQNMTGPTITPAEMAAIESQMANLGPISMGPASVTGLDPMYNARGQYIGPPIINPNTGMPW